MTPRHFGEHLEVLQQYAHPIKLQQLSQGLLYDDLPNQAVIVTFDDGYADNLYNARPLLERYEVPATVFLTTGYIGHEREFWWDELDQMLLQPGTLPKVLRLSINGNTYRWELGKAAYYGEKTAQRRRYWRAWKYSFSFRHRLYRSLYELLYPLAENERRRVLDELLAWADIEPAVRPTHRPLSFEEVVDLEGELVEIGAHTVTHPALSTLPAAWQQKEIRESKARLQGILGRRVDSFAYPHGDMSAEAEGIVREAGFACACSCISDVVGRSTNLFRLPRVEVQDWDGKKFARQLSRWFGG